MPAPDPITEIAKIGGSFVAGLLGGGAGHRIVNKFITTRLSEVEKIQSRQTAKQQDLERRLMDHIADNARQHSEDLTAQGKTEDAVGEVAKSLAELSKELYKQYGDLMRLLGEKIDRYEDRGRRRT